MRILVLLVIVAALWGCREQKTYSTDLHGRWNVIYAERSGRSTSTLKDAYFSFLGDSILRTNLLREEKDFAYTFDGTYIQQIGEQEITYQVLHLNQDTMLLGATIQNNEFKFLTLRDSIDPTVLSQE